MEFVGVRKPMEREGGFLCHISIGMIIFREDGF